ncbi:MotA/TolQ/ExbB proton channel family protein [Pseudomonas sp. NW5]|uniref:MotA/TolQ/ExbB proton channel family protein n=1 Tax=Pseudomonas sp. NW5 TaxID=2934934 RepID=UPI00201FB584|nr:MotA/TolQ/ExbB proton channel family protein [Pseudomonas sp. NW5]MCL7462915.1 MotA/TolQ/ExbB proton channel family protein [Pseudomonas sp. NW5]
MNALEQLMSEVAGLFLSPVLLMLAAMFVYALFEWGRFMLELVQGARRARPLAAFHRRHPQADAQDIELHLLRRLEPLRLVSRVAPMLGLVATMIPMGPALMSVANGDFAAVADSLTVAFAAVIIALMAASMAFWMLSVRRRWLLEELKQLLHQGAVA